MEQARFMMWSNRRPGLSSHLQAPTNSSYGDSWEEQAFAEDAAGALGGCTWPPRSYSCSFCRREFRSAQALGGHMNVHRRDRARLKQCPRPEDDGLLHRHHQNHQYPSQTRVSPSQEKSDEKVFCPIFPSPILEGNRKRPSMLGPPAPWSNFVADTYFRVPDPNNDQQGKNSNSKFPESNGRAKKDSVTTDLSVSLNLVVRQARLAAPGEKDDEAVSCKRRRIDSTPLPLLLKSNSTTDVQSHHPQSEVLDQHSSGSVEVLDLELRLGDRPEVN
ncbi:hypothetical protein NMG60_11005377 [Bertholletia excelsa]